MINGVKDIKLQNYLKYNIKISDNFIEKKENRIYFNDITLLKCKTWRQHANYFGTKIYFGNFNQILIMDDKKNKLDLNFSSKNEESFNSFKEILSLIIGPLVRKIAKRITNGDKVVIDNLLLTNMGILKKGIFKKKFLEWGNCTNVLINGGFINIFQNDGNKFSAIYTWKENAIILPELINYFNSRKTL